MPLNEFRAEAKKHLENTLISIKTKNKVTTQNVNITKKKNGTNKKIQQTPRGQLHNETVYGSLRRYKVEEKRGVRIVGFETVYTIRKEISPDLKIDKVIDVGVRKILEKRLADFGGDRKKAFSNLDENPIWLNEEKGISIKRVTISGIANAESLHDKRDKEGRLILDKDGNKQPVDFVNTGNNHHVAVYRAPVLDEKGNHEQDEQGNKKYKLQENVISFYEAVARRNAGLPVIDREYKAGEGWEFLFSMKQNEYFVFPRIEKRERVDQETGEILMEDVVTFDPKEVDLLDPENYARISPNLFRVVRFSKVMYGNSASRDYWFRHHYETSSKVETFKELRDIGYKSIKSLPYFEGIVKVRVNHIGRIIGVGEY